jgi:phage-related protein (TIGR01555 family)
MKINTFGRLWSWARGMKPADIGPAPPAFAPPMMLPGVVPKGDKMAMDDAMADVYSYASQMYGACAQTFPGYPVLAQLMQVAEYRMLSEKTAHAMTRKWIKLHSKGDKDNSERISQIEDALTRFKVRELFTEAAIHDGFFGRAQLFVDLGEQEGDGLAIPLFEDSTIVKNKLRKFKLVEAMFTYPNSYSASNPLRDDYFNPSSWFVMGQKVHSSRLLTFVGRPLPDILKPAYNFGGMSMSQLAMPYVNNWLKTRDSVNRMISNYSTSGIKTNMSSVLQGDSGDDLMARAQLYAEMRDNQGLMLMDMEQEEFFQFNTPLSTLDQLQAQAQEHMASVASMPLPILLGITPSGLNASADGDIEIFYDHVRDMQERLFRDNLTKVIKLIQLSEFGDVDEDIVFDFVSLWQQTEAEMAANRKSDAEAAAIYVELGAILPEEVRQRLADDEHSGYNGLDMGVRIEPPAEEEPDPLPGDDE